jgi:hypothetical protein
MKNNFQLGLIAVDTIAVEEVSQLGSFGTGDAELWHATITSNGRQALSSPSHK